MKTHFGWLKGLLVGIGLAAILAVWALLAGSSGRAALSGLVMYGLLFGFLGLCVGRMRDLEDIKKSKPMAVTTNKGNVYGGVFGFVAACLLTIWTVSGCDSSCSESPVYILLILSFPILTMVGALAGSFWRNHQ